MDFYSCLPYSGVDINTMASARRFSLRINLRKTQRRLVSLCRPPCTAQRTSASRPTCRMLHLQNPACSSTPGLTPAIREAWREWLARPRLCENTQMWYASGDTGVHLCPPRSIRRFVGFCKDGTKSMNPLSERMGLWVDQREGNAPRPRNRHHACPVRARRDRYLVGLTVARIAGASLQQPIP